MQYLNNKLICRLLTYPKFEGVEYIPTMTNVSRSSHKLQFIISRLKC